MQDYRVAIDPEALQKINEAARYIAQDSEQNAMSWLLGLEDLIGKLGRFPHSYGDARERKPIRRELKQVVYHSHRVIFEIDDERRVVNVVTVIHGAQNFWR